MEIKMIHIKNPMNSYILCISGGIFTIKSDILEGNERIIISYGNDKAYIEERDNMDSVYKELIDFLRDKKRDYIKI